MYVRISFDGNAEVSKEELKQLETTLADQINHADLVKKQDGKLGTFYNWCETFDPNDPKLSDGKTTLVFSSNMVRLTSDKEYLVDLEYFLTKHPNIKILVRGTPKTIERDYTSVVEQMIAIQAKFENALKSFDQQIEFNQKCDVHIGNLGLLNINQTGYAVDFCTEQLQELLNQGWRILTVCPQPDQRRPDYILGRYNPESDQLVCVKF